MPKTFSGILQAAAERQGLRDRGGVARISALLRERHGLEVAPSTISCWLTGQRTPRAGNLAALVDALDLDLEERDLAWRLLAPFGAGEDESEVASASDGE
jgi:hypothetical protein